MNRISIGNIEDIVVFVKAMHVDVYYDLPNNNERSYIAVFKYNEELEDANYYTWKLVYKYKNNVDSIAPSAYGVIKRFKTEYGVKNNLIAYLKKNPL
jgi:hypothetical protein